MDDPSDFDEIARRLVVGPFANSSDYQKILGDALAKPVHWQGRQWAVTASGIQCRDGRYHIAPSQLWSDEGVFSQVESMAEKEWVDLQDFVIALTLARIQFKEYFGKNHRS